MRATCSTRFAEPWVGPMATEVKLPRLAPVSRELILAYIGERVLGLPKSY